jgi:hypothetical protein
MECAVIEFGRQYAVTAAFCRRPDSFTLLASAGFLLEMRPVGKGPTMWTKSISFMNLSLLHPLLLLPLLSFGACAALASERSNVRMEFVHPERFTDFRIQGRNEIDSARIFRDQVSSYLSPLVAKRFPDATLSLRFTDIDLAGRLAPSRIRKFNNVRFDREGASPLRLEFEYTLTDQKGSVLTTGSQRLVESDYLRRYINYPNSEKVATLFYEKVTLSRWLSYLTPTGSRLARK